MSECIREISVAVEVDTNKATYQTVIYSLDVDEIVRQVREFIETTSA